MWVGVRKLFYRRGTRMFRKGDNNRMKNRKTKNIYKPKSLKRHVWTIARLDGWKGYQSEIPSGITTLWIGLQNSMQLN